MPENSSGALGLQSFRFSLLSSASNRALRKQFPSTMRIPGELVHSGAKSEIGTVTGHLLSTCPGTVGRKELECLGFCDEVCKMGHGLSH